MNINQEIIDFNKYIEQINMVSDTIIKVISQCRSSLKNGNKILICGNGGSAADSQHFAAELIGRYKKERKSIPAIALTTDTSILTSISNDYDFSKIFSRQIEGLGKQGDVLICISTSGNSLNVINAAEYAKTHGIKIISITGKSGGKLKDISDLNINIQGDKTNHIQECHLFIEHIICEGIEE